MGGTDQLIPTYLSLALTRVCVRAGLEARIRKVFQEFDDAKAKELVESICNIVAVGRKVSVFNLSRSDGSDLDKAMLAAILDNMPTKPLETGVDEVPISKAAAGQKQRSVQNSLALARTRVSKTKQGFYRIYIGVQEHEVRKKRPVAKKTSIVQSHMPIKPTELTFVFKDGSENQVDSGLLAESRGATCELRNFILGGDGSPRDLADVKSIVIKIDRREKDTESQQAVQRAYSSFKENDTDESLWGMEYVKIEYIDEVPGKQLKREEMIWEEAVFDVGDDIVRMLDLGTDANHNVKPFVLGRDNEQRLKAEVARLYGAYHQSLGKLRIAMAFDRVETVRHLLQETRVAWNEMRGHFMQVYEIQPTEAAKCQKARVEKLLEKAYPPPKLKMAPVGSAKNKTLTLKNTPKEPSEPTRGALETFYALYGFDTNEKLQFSSQVSPKCPRSCSRGGARPPLAVPLLPALPARTSSADCSLVVGMVRHAFTRLDVALLFAVVGRQRHRPWLPLKLQNRRRVDKCHLFPLALLLGPAVTGAQVGAETE